MPQDPSRRAGRPPAYPVSTDLSRRTLLGAAALAASGWVQAAGRPGAAPAKLASQLRIVVPANAGGGWDQTGRALGEALQAGGLVDSVHYENVGGKGGILGLQHYTQRYASDPDSLLMGGMVMVGALALHQPAVSLAQLQPLARLTSDFMVLAVRADSPIRQAKDLLARMQRDLSSVVVAGASAGSVDHMFIGRLVRAARANPEQLQYLPFAGGAQVVDAVLKGQAQVAISGYSELQDMLASGKLRAIGVSARRALYGIPAVREQGFDADMGNWRGVFTGGQVSPQRKAQLVAAVKSATTQPSWQEALKRNRWQSALLTGADLQTFLDTERTVAEGMVYMLRLKA